ncbi:RNA-guided endonuclease TnpB family protein [Mycobacterium sp. B14F4]|uniref:RNA-guided endonuclease InsQ/TnpB family protein n=1 Tax=Mycobacterium sp. B14F4 TaxID=3153565 RepID=UPI00325F7D4A
MLASSMARHTTFRFCLDPTTEQRDALARHSGAARFAYNQCLRMVKTALTARKIDPKLVVPWTGFDLVNAFNRWKKTEAAGRVWAVASDGVVEVGAIGLSWRGDVCQQVSEEAAVDCGRALAAWSDSRSGRRKGRRVGFPRFKKKAAGLGSFRLRNTNREGRRPAIRVGDDSRTRAITLPRIGTITVHDDTRRLRRMLANGRARILFATISHRGSRWWVSLSVEAADLHPLHCHPPRADGDDGGWVGVDRGTAFAVAAADDGTEVARFDAAPKPLRSAMARHRRLSKKVTQKRKGSRHHQEAVSHLRRHNYRIANIRRHYLHQVSNSLVKTHDRLAIENLNVTGMLANHRLAQAISDAGWAEFARMLNYKQAWRGGQLVLVDRYFPSSRTCAGCGSISAELTLADRSFTCECGHAADRDHNAAVNLARWAQKPYGQNRSPDPQAGGRVTNARRQADAVQHPRCAGDASLNEAGTGVHTPRELLDAREGRCPRLTRFTVGHAS